MMLSFLKRKTAPATDPIVQTDPSGLSLEHVRWAYRLFLDREPESEDVMARKLEVWQTTRELRQHFLNSTEFKNLHPDNGQIVDIERNIVIKEMDNGLRIFLDLADHMIGRKVLNGSYEPIESEFVRQNIEPGQNVLDIGANIGYFTIFLADLVGEAGRIHAFEPIPNNLELLRRTIAENHFEHRVKIEPFGVGAQTADEQFVFLPSELGANSGGSYLHRDDSPLLPEHKLQDVRIVALDEQEFPRPISFIKADIEGAEMLAFRGARRILGEDRPLILAELNPPQLRKVSGCTTGEMIAEMAELGYECRRLVAEGPGELVDGTGEELCSVVFKAPV